MLRPLVWAAFSAGLAFGQAPFNKPTTVAQLSEYLAGSAAHEPDAALARAIGSLQLTERLTAATLARLEDGSHAGPQTRQALQLLADESTFLGPPASEVVNKPAPGVSDQQAIMNAAVNFVAVTLRRLPDFFATRITQSFDDAPTAVTHSGWAPAGEMHGVGTFHQPITYRQGKEVLGESSKSDSQGSGPQGLTSTGEFGPLLATILRDTSHGTVAWSRWESMSGGVAAVFRYEVPATASHYVVNYCCVKSIEDPTAYAGDGVKNSYHGTPAYRGELSIDPATGSILRVTLMPELKASDPITQAGVAIDFGPVEIQGDKTYVCPVHSLALTVADSAGGDFGSRSLTRINEVTFSGYHRFGSTIRMVTPVDQP